MISPSAPTPTPPADCGTFDLACKATRAVGSILDDFVATVARGAADLIVTTSTWWTTTDSVDPRDSAVIAAQGATSTLVGIIVFGSILVQAIRLILSHKAEPLLMVATGLFRFAIVSALGLVVLQGALRAGDALATSVMSDAANNFALFMVDTLTGPNNVNNTFITLLCAVIGAVLSLIQWLLMAIRQAGLLVLAAMLPLAASGSLNRSTRGWLDKVITWLIAIVVYKPAAAFIYFIGFSYLSSPSSNTPGSISTQITGLMVLLLAVLAMPILLKFFAWSGTQVSGTGGGGSGMLGAAGAVALAHGTGRSPAVQGAADLESSGPGSASTSSTPPPSGVATGAASTTAAPTAAGAGAAGGSTAGAGAAGPAGVAVAVIAAGAAATKAAGSQFPGDAPEEGRQP
ncbi:MAG: hypothetical protein J0I49_08570 [Pseudonocardia sp.]|mgnify:CR=1 FL=1|uniref:hypothetical protein n=1 Tax=Pseudonocardia sp. TaxID=60912 RepID=UPI001AD2B9E4|nr:hypothetical protein [Pseudonocardia sp.]MBN9098148.1 hypothetical protein [Pseudonocardia sp.]